MISGESEGMAIENDVNVFRETLNDLVNLEREVPPLKRGPGSVGLEKILWSVQQTQKSFSMIVAEPSRERAAASRKTVARSAAGSKAK